MKKNKELLGFTLVTVLAILAVLLYAVSVNFGGCGNRPDCLVVLVFGAPFQYYFLPALALLLSLVPLFFTREHTYIAWRKFAVWALPVMLILIFISPTQNSGNWAINLDLTREMAALFSAVVFTLTSWLITARTALSAGH